MKGLSKHLLIAKARDIFVKPLRDRSDSIIKTWADQCEFIFAHRLRRGQQLISHYRRIWQEKDLLLFLMVFRRTLGVHTKKVLLASAPFLFDWNKERISNEVIHEQMKEIDYVYRLQEGTLFCSVCHLRKIIDRRLDGISYCRCRTGHSKATASMDEWEPYLERDNIIIWRQPQGAGQYAYKVYGKYRDVSAEDFFFVQTDVGYRKEWDKSALALDIIDTDQELTSNCNVLYWEMLWPKLFANRDYVFKRRTVVDRKNHLMVIVNQSTEHPNCPVLPKNQRVNDYWSYMVIKPQSTFRKEGLEFVLTYFDNPGIVIPPTVTTWVAKTHMPDFLNKLHLATIRYAAGKDLSLVRDERFNDDVEEVNAGFAALDYFWNYCPEPGFEYPPEPEIHFSDGNGVSGGGGNDGVKLRDLIKRSLDIQSESADQDDVVEEERESTETEEKTGEQEAVATESKGRTSWWSYLHPYSYFA